MDYRQFVKWIKFNTCLGAISCDLVRFSRMLVAASPTLLSPSFTLSRLDRVGLGWTHLRGKFTAKGAKSAKG